MGKLPKNFALLKRTGNPRVSIRRLQATNSAGSSTAAAEDRTTRGEDNNSGDEELSDERAALVVNAGENSGGGGGKNAPWTPSLSAVFKILFSMRLSASLWSVISDCDEVYNYWEPLHLLLFGRGFQTWEYSPAYAIRSWLYIWLYAAPAQLLMPVFGHSKVTLFFTLRFLIGFFTLLSELLLYRQLCRRFGGQLGRAFVLFSLFSSAMFGASTAFLPSAFSMAMNAFATAFYLGEQWFLAILCTAVSALVGWPFAALLGLPIAVEMLVIRPRRRQLALRFGLYTVGCGGVLGGALFAVDSHFFGRPVLAPLNIVLYNVFSPHGPSLYGVEPASFYVRNLALNFNLAFPLALLAVPSALLLGMLVRKEEKRRKDGADPLVIRVGRFADWPLKHWNNLRPMLLLATAAALWLLIFLLQPHKEERFLFPIYPHICVLAALGLDCLCRVVPDRRHSLLLSLALMAAFVGVSLSRNVAVHRNYAGLLDTYKAFNDRLAASGGELDTAGMSNNSEQFEPNSAFSPSAIRLCVGKEWHRFPSSFFLPDKVQIPGGNDSNIGGDSGDSDDGLQLPVELRFVPVELRFVRSEFRGLLPGQFPRGPVPNATRRVPTDQNDQNREEAERYVPLESCHFLVDLSGPEPTSPLEPDYAAEMSDQFQSIIQRRVLLPARSHPLFRAFYIPFTPEGYLNFGTVHMLQRKSKSSNNKQ